MNTKSKSQKYKEFITDLAILTVVWAVTGLLVFVIKSLLNLWGAGSSPSMTLGGSGIGLFYGGGIYARAYAVGKGHLAIRYYCLVAIVGLGLGVAYDVVFERIHPADAKLLIVVLGTAFGFIFGVVVGTVNLVLGKEKREAR